MPLTQSDLASHPLWPMVDAVRQQLESALSNASDEEAGLITDWLQVLTFTERLREIEPWRFAQSGAVLESLRAQSEALKNDLQPLIEDPDVNIAPQLGARLDAYSGVLAQAPTWAVTSGHLSGVTTQVERLRSAVTAAIGEVKERSASASEEAEKRFEDLSATLDAVQTNLVSEKERVDRAIADHSERFATNLTSWTEEVSAAIKEAREAGEAQRSNEAAKADEQLQELGRLVEQSRSMVEVTARNTISTGYAQYARRQGWSATAWSVAAVAVALGGLIAMFIIVRDLNQVTLTESVFKATLTTGLLATAAFMGREATGHRKEARDAKRTQLDLNTLEPFLSSLKDTDATELRRQLALRIFNRPLANGPGVGQGVPTIQGGRDSGGEVD